MLSYLKLPKIHNVYTLVDSEDIKNYKKFLTSYFEFSKKVNISQFATGMILVLTGIEF